MDGLEVKGALLAARVRVVEGERAARLAELREALAAGEVTELGRVARYLTGARWALGARVAAERAAALETAARSRRPEEAAAALAIREEELDRLAADVARPDWLGLPSGT